MKADDIIKIIEVLPRYILYFYPGYITIYCYYFFRGKTLKDTKVTLIKSIILSYIYVSLTAFIPVDSIIWANIGYIVLAVSVAYISFIITKTEWIYDFLQWFNIYTTFYENEIEALSGIENGAWLIVYVKDENIAIEGSLGHKELEEDKERYITLEGYIKHSIKSDGTFAKPPIVDYTEKYNEKCVIKYTEIKRIEKRDNSDA